MCMSKIGHSNEYSVSTEAVVKRTSRQEMSIPTESAITVVLSETAGVALLGLDITMDGKSNKR